MIHAFPRSSRMMRWSLCYAAHRNDVARYFASGDCSKLRKRVTCPECSSRIGRLLAEAQRLR